MTENNNPRPVLTLVTARTKPGDFKPTNKDGFRKALAAITILSDMTAKEALASIENWIEKGLINIEERAALHQFYGIVP